MEQVLLLASGFLCNLVIGLSRNFVFKQCLWEQPLMNHLWFEFEVLKTAGGSIKTLVSARGHDLDWFPIDVWRLLHSLHFGVIWGEAGIFWTPVAIYWRLFWMVIAWAYRWHVAIHNHFFCVTSASWSCFFGRHLLIRTSLRSWIATGVIRSGCCQRSQYFLFIN